MWLPALLSVFFFFSLPEICTIVHFLLSSQYLWCGLTIALSLPGYLVQLLSFVWFQADGHRCCCALVMLHALQLGIWKR